MIGMNKLFYLRITKTIDQTFILKNLENEGDICFDIVMMCNIRANDKIKVKSKDNY